MSNLLLLQAKVFSDAQKNVHLLSTSRYLICLKYNSIFACNLSENCRLLLCAFLTSHSQKKTYSFIFLRQILSCYNLKISFSKLVKVLVLVLVLELFYGTRTRVHFSISLLVVEVFCGTRTHTRKLSTRLHHWCKYSPKKSLQNFFSGKNKGLRKFFSGDFQKKVFNKTFQAIYIILTIQKIVLSSSRGQGNFRGLEASRPRPRT